MTPAFAEAIGIRIPHRTLPHLMSRCYLGETRESIPNVLPPRTGPARRPFDREFDLRTARELLRALPERRDAHRSRRQAEVLRAVRVRRYGLRLDPPQRLAVRLVLGHTADPEPQAHHRSSPFSREMGEASPALGTPVVRRWTVRR